MRTILMSLILALLLGALQYLPLGDANGLEPFTVGNALADEAQDAIDNAPPIMQAAYERDWKKVIAIAKKNRKALREKDDLGLTILHEAAHYAPDAVVVELIRLGADKNIKESSSPFRYPYDYAKENASLTSTTRDMLKPSVRK